MYVFDSGPLIDLFNHYYPDRFPTLWENFESLVSLERIVSVREVANEIEGHHETDRLVEWTKNNRKFFSQPTKEELLVVAEIFRVTHYQTMIRKRERLQGKPVADPFVIAKAKACNGWVVTNEKFKENSAQIPNVCKHFGIPCINLEGFMNKEGWTF